MQTVKTYALLFVVTFFVGCLVGGIISIWYPHAWLFYGAGWAISWTGVEIAKDFFIARKHARKN